MLFVFRWISSCTQGLAMDSGSIERYRPLLRAASVNCSSKYLLLFTLMSNNELRPFSFTTTRSRSKTSTQRRCAVDAAVVCCSTINLHALLLQLEMQLAHIDNKVAELQLAINQNRPALPPEKKPVRKRSQSGEVKKEMKVVDARLKLLIDAQLSNEGVAHLDEDQKKLQRGLMNAVKVAHRLRLIKNSTSVVKLPWTNWSPFIQTLPQMVAEVYLDIILAGHGKLLRDMLVYLEERCLRAGMENAFLRECSATPILGADLGSM